MFLKLSIILLLEKFKVLPRYTLLIKPPIKNTMPILHNTEIQFAKTVNPIYFFELLQRFINLLFIIISNPPYLVDNNYIELSIMLYLYYVHNISIDTYSCLIYASIT